MKPFSPLNPIPDTPELPPLVPSRGTAATRWFWRRSLHSHGWKIEGEVPNVPKAIMLGAPHTSNMDGWLGIQSMLALGLDMSILIKDSAYNPLVKRFLDWLHFIPVNRSSPQGLLDEIDRLFSEHEKLWIGIAPEGTRFKPEHWKSGFYRMAVRAKVPLVLVGFDYQHKVMRFLGQLTPTGDYEKDLAIILQLYRGLVPRHPDRLSLPLRQQ